MNAFPRYAAPRALRNMRRNLFPNVTTIGIITISVLIFSTFSLIAFNLASFLRTWEGKMEIVVYLKKKTPTNEVETLLKKIRLFEGVESVKYISPSDAMTFMEANLSRQKNLLEGIQSAVFPASFEIQLKKDYRNSKKIREVASGLKPFQQIEEIQYGQEWVEAFSSFLLLLRLTQWVLGGLLVVAMVFIISNTLQMAISSRREEIEVLHLMGASPSFIRVPFYIEGIIQGLLGAGAAILLLFLLHKAVSLYVTPSMQGWLARIPLLFLPPEVLVSILSGGMVLGFLGSVTASVRLPK
jgi:cell division transport system permease protein